MMLHMGLENLYHKSLIKYSVNKVLQVFGQAGVNFVITEMQKLHYRKYMEPKNL